jgi:hypothetical protein
VESSLLSQKRGLHLNSFFSFPFTLHILRKEFFVNLTILGGAKMIRSIPYLSAFAMVFVFANAPMALAGGKIIIPVNQNQTAVNVGNQNQQAGGGAGNTTQTGVLDQGISQSQNVNIFVPESFKGKVQVRDGAQGNGNQGFGRDEEHGHGHGYGHHKEKNHGDYEGKGEKGRD